MSHDYIPGTLAGTSDWLDNFSSLLTAAPTDYGLTAPDAVTVAGVNATYQAAYTASTNPSTRTSAAVATTRGARTAALAVVRPYAMRINANTSVSNAQRVDLGITVRTTVPTPIPPPGSAPGNVLIGATPGVLRLAYNDSANPDPKAKPFGVIGVEVWAAVGTVPAVSPAAAGYKLTATKTPFNLAFDSGDAAKVATIYTRFVNRSGSSGIAARGPWSAALVTVII